MSAEDKVAFRSAMRETMRLFRLEENRLRTDYAGELQDGQVEIADILERPTRRFLIDGLLRALDWDPDDSAQVGEEVRSRSRGTGKPLFFDYLGRARDRAPALLVEAKRLDAELPRQPHEPEPSSREMARLISRELARLKGCAGQPALLALWTGWLNDVIGYVKSLSPADQQRIARVAITAGRWLIIFESPFAAFVAEGVPDPDCIMCFQSFEEMEQGSEKIFDLLSRGRLIDTLPLTMTPGEALEVLQPADIKAMFRGVVVTTQMVGPVRGPYPLRSVHPAVVLTSAKRAFAVTGYLSAPLTEPTDASGLASFLKMLAARGDIFQAEVLGQFGRLDLMPAPAAQYPIASVVAQPPDRLMPAHSSTAAQVAANPHSGSRLVHATGERGADREFLVITGETWFYKSVAPTGVDCELHAWPKARARGVAGPDPSMGWAATSYTASGDPQHCEHEGLRGLRKERCSLRSLETHICCRACVFHDVCWSLEDLPRLPCAV